MAHSDRIGYVTGAVEHNTETAKPTTPLSNAQKQARWRQRRKDERERMKRIVDKAQALNDALKGVTGEQLTLPLSCVSDDVEQTLTNLREYINQHEASRENARSQTKGGRKKAKKQRMT